MGMDKETACHDKRRLCYSTLMNNNLLGCVISKVSVIQIVPTHINGMAQIKLAKYGASTWTLFWVWEVMILKELIQNFSQTFSLCYPSSCGHEHHKRHHHHDHKHDSAVSSVSIVAEGSLDLDEVDYWLERIIEEKGDNLYRMNFCL